MSATGNIYDLGYRRYEGPRLGRRHAFGALFAHSLRSTYGIGRGGRAKIAPFGLALMAVVPAVIAVGFIALVRQAGAGDEVVEASPLRYETYFGVIGVIVFLFCAAQAPELLGRDQRYGVLSLYFSRALERTDYALAKVAAFITAILLLILVPQAVIFVGLVLSAADVPAGILDNLPEVPPILAQGATLAGLYGALSLVIAAFTPRRAYATVAIIAAFIVPPVVAEVVGELGSGGLADWLVLLSPASIVDATNAWFFDIRPDSGIVAAADHPGELWILVAGLWVAACLVVLMRRYQRIAA